MKSKFKTASVSQTQDGHKRIRLIPSGNEIVELLIDGQTYKCESKQAARIKAQGICRQILEERKKKQYAAKAQKRLPLGWRPEDDHKWVEYIIIVKEKKADATTINTDKADASQFDSSLAKGKNIRRREILIERYPSQVTAFVKGQAGLPETNRRRH